VLLVLVVGVVSGGPTWVSAGSTCRRYTRVRVL